MSNNQRFKDPRGGFCGHYQNVKLLINNGLAKFFESFFYFPAHIHNHSRPAGFVPADRLLLTMLISLLFSSRIILRS